ncbi:DUF2958 domain-containing protein [Shinella yambaruensis]|uniref:DUF2958 domain-containing protein n=1 Tax=Shinella yambaruensis TaxID=415996 RepID=UPI003D78BFAC
MRRGGNSRDEDGLSPEVRDLALLFLADLHIDGKSIHKLRAKRPFRVRYELDGHIRDQAFLSSLSWRAVMLFALEDRKCLTVHEMDETGRLAQTFPAHIMARLAENARNGGDVIPALRLVDPERGASAIVTRSRGRGHAVDVLHDLGGSPVFQPLWISDLLRLDALIGIMKLVRDEAFAPTMPISTYLEAAAMTGRIVAEPELATMQLTGIVPRLPQPRPLPAVLAMFEERCRTFPALARLRERTIYDEYKLRGAT